ncbi:MAG: DUF1275 domain-containing protein, partial [Neisseriaceae bacterium]|nr:DUF1275 domain-containing protein [Neisseriaceae bacterium]
MNRKERKRRAKIKNFRPYSHDPTMWHHRLPYAQTASASFRGFRLLGYVMAFLAGAINSGGFFAVARYTSHMSGEIARMADMMAIGELRLAFSSFIFLLCFIGGAMHASWLIIWGKRHRFRASYGLPIWIEAFYLLVFGLLGAALSRYSVQFFMPPTIMILCFIMGMHNTVMTVLSNGVLRSTHMTGFATDIGIELSKVFYRQHDPRASELNINPDRAKILLFSGLLLSFFLGGVVGAYGFHGLGFQFTLPVAFVLMVLGIRPIWHDVKLRYRLWMRLRRRARHWQAVAAEAAAEAEA